VISVSKTILVNPPDTDIRLERADVWRGLEAKANNALPFVPSMTYCEVISQSGNVIEREIEFRGDRFGERVTLTEPEQVVFERTWGPVLGVIRNEILQDPGGELRLRFAFDLELEGVAADSEQEREYERTMSGDYLKAVDATLAAIRRWVGEGTPVAGAEA
jgi:Domain of unknown function (DUF1857)